jgi:uncharacterized phage protein gp47/JayE
MAFTSTGYDVVPFQDIKEGIRLDLETTLGTPISADPDTIIGITNSVFANEVSTVENNLQALVNNLSILTAEGIYLDELVRYVGLTRRPNQSAAGSLKVWRNGEGLVPTSTSYSTSVGELFIISSALDHSLLSCAEMLLTPVTVVEGVVYTITINTVLFTYTALEFDTATEVVDYFVTEIANGLSLTTGNESDTLRVSGADDDLNSLSVVITNFTPTEVAVFAFSQSVESKLLTVVENTITTVVTENPNLLRANNPLPFVDGADTETDEELRARHQVSIQVGGNATVPAITSKLLQLSGVTTAFIVENTTLVVDGGGRPAKSYESFVLGGDPAVIGQEVWDTKPAGVETFGDINTAIVDVAGNAQAVNWSRPEPVYIFVRVTYKLYSEESFPAGGEDVMTDAVKATGDDLAIGVDVIPTRFIGGIYSAVEGVDEITVEVGSSLDIGDVSPVGGYVTTTISIAETQNTDFATARITMVQI